MEERTEGAAGKEESGRGGGLHHEYVRDLGFYLGFRGLTRGHDGLTRGHDGLTRVQDTLRACVRACTGLALQEGRGEPMMPITALCLQSLFLRSAGAVIARR